MALLTQAFWASVLLYPWPTSLERTLVFLVVSPLASSSLRRKRHQTEILRPPPACPVPRALSPVPEAGGPTSGYGLSLVGQLYPHSPLMDTASQSSLLCIFNFSFLPAHPRRRTAVSFLPLLNQPSLPSPPTQGRAAGARFILLPDARTQPDKLGGQQSIWRRRQWVPGRWKTDAVSPRTGRSLPESVQWCRADKGPW